MNKTEKEAPSWKQLGYDSAEDLEGKIGYEGGFDMFFFSYGCSIEDEYQNTDFAKAFSNLHKARDRVRYLLNKDGIDPDGMEC